MLTVVRIASPPCPFWLDIRNMEALEAGSQPGSRSDAENFAIFGAPRRRASRHLTVVSVT